MDLGYQDCNCLGLGVNTGLGVHTDDGRCADRRTEELFWREDSGKRLVTDHNVTRLSRAICLQLTRDVFVYVAYNALNTFATCM